MPGNVSAVAGDYYFGEKLLSDVRNGSVSQQRVAEMAERVMTPFFLLGQDEDFPSVDPSAAAAFLTYQYGHGSSSPISVPIVPARNVRGNHSELIREMGAAGTVLLKNEGGFLPLRNQTHFGIFGNGAPLPTVGSVFLDYGAHPEGFEMGTVDIGGGSGTVRHTFQVSPYEALSKKIEEMGGRVQWLFENGKVADGDFRTIYPIPEVCLLFVKAYGTEGTDRTSINLEWNATQAVESTAALCPKTIVIIQSPGVITIPWADNENVTAILAAHFQGEQAGNSIADVLWGVAEPSGRLPYTIPKLEGDYGPAIVSLTGPVTEPNAWQSNFSEGLFIDYRHFDAQKIEPLYEFGYGLGYTEFEMLNSSLTLNITPGLSAGPNENLGIAAGGLVDLWSVVGTITVNVTNVGYVPGHAVPQLYVSFPQKTTPSGTPLNVLRGFEKRQLGPGEEGRFAFDVTRRDLSFWDVERHQWMLPQDEFVFRVGFSSRDFRAEVSRAVRQ